MLEYLENINLPFDYVIGGSLACLIHGIVLERPIKDIDLFTNFDIEIIYNSEDIKTTYKDNKIYYKQHAIKKETMIDIFYVPNFYCCYNEYNLNDKIYKVQTINQIIEHKSYWNQFKHLKDLWTIIHYEKINELKNKQFKILM